MIKHSPSIVTAYTEGLVGRKVGAGEVNPYCKVRQSEEYDAWLRGYYMLGLHEGVAQTNYILEALSRLETLVKQLNSRITDLETVIRHGR